MRRVGIASALTHTDRPVNHMSFWQGFKYVVQARTYLQLLNPILWVWMGLAVVQNVYLLYMKYVLNREAQFVIFLVCAALGARRSPPQSIMMVACFLSMPVYFTVMARLGKRLTFAVGLLVRAALRTCRADRPDHAAVPGGLLFPGQQHPLCRPCPAPGRQCVAAARPLARAHAAQSAPALAPSTCCRTPCCRT